MAKAVSFQKIKATKDDPERSEIQNPACKIVPLKGIEKKNRMKNMDR